MEQYYDETKGLMGLVGVDGVMATLTGSQRVAVRDYLLAVLAGRSGSMDVEQWDSMSDGQRGAVLTVIRSARQLMVPLGQSEDIPF